MESRVWLMLTNSFSRHKISFHKMQLLVMSMTLTSWDALVKCTKGKMQHLISPTLTLYDNITSPGNSHRTTCVCLCVFVCGLSAPALSKLEHCSQNKIQPDGDCNVVNDRQTACVWCHIKCKREAVPQS